MAFELFILGFVTLLGQVVLLRELQVSFYGVELLYILGLAFWLLWVAIGALWGCRAAAPSAARVRGLFLGFGLLLPAEVALVRDLRPLLGAVPGAYLPFPQQLLAAALVLLPIGCLSGFMFQRAASRYLAVGRTLARAYAVESAGALVGGLVSTVLLRLGVGNFDAALGSAGLGLMVPLVGAVGRPGRSLAAVALALLGVLAAALWQGAEIDAHLTRWTHPALAASQDSPYGRVTIDRQGDQFNVFENDALAFETAGTSSEEFVHLAALHHPGPERVLLLGGGVEGLPAEILKHHPRQVEVVELNRVLLDLARRHLPAERLKALAENTVRLRIADPRVFLDRPGAYDLIFSAASEPASGQANRFYTREFFGECRDRLGPDGLLALRLTSSENVWSPLLTARNAGIHRALKAVFRDVLVLPGTTNILLASNRPLERDPEVLVRRFARRRLETRLVTPAYIRYVHTNDRFFEIRRELAQDPTPANTDVRPLCYRYAGLIWLSQFFPRLMHQDATGAWAGPVGWAASAMGMVGLAGLILWARRSPGRTRVLLVAAAGFIGMMLETMLLLYYQAKSGVLYQDIGLLLTAFMAGLAGGAGFVSLTIKGGRFEALSDTLAPYLKLGFLVLGLASFFMVHFSAAPGLWPTFLLLLAAGFLVAGVFAWAGLAGGADQHALIGPLYAADLIGGSLGSLAGSLVLIPFLGLPETALLAAALALATLFMI